MTYIITNSENSQKLEFKTIEQALTALRAYLVNELGEDHDNEIFNNEENTPIAYKLECIFGD